MSSKIFAKANKVQFQDQQLDDYVLEVRLFTKLYLVH